MRRNRQFADTQRRLGLDGVAPPASHKVVDLTWDSMLLCNLPTDLPKSPLLYAHLLGKVVNFLSRRCGS
jgi:hypothetical protein